LWHNEFFGFHDAQLAVSLRPDSGREFCENQEWLLPCPICQKRPPRRFCPAKAEDICAICCGTEREATIDCPSDCPYLVASRQYDRQRREVDWSKIPFADTKIPSSFVAAHEKLLLAISYAVCLHARDERSTVDSDALASLQALAETYKTLDTGIYYEKPPEFRLQRELYDRLKALNRLDVMRRIRSPKDWSTSATGGVRWTLRPELQLQGEKIAEKRSEGGK